MSGSAAGPLGDDVATGGQPPLPSPEQLAEWRRIIERLEQGDDTVVVSWSEVLRDLGFL